MRDRFAPAQRVRVRLLDPTGHTRAPHYVRGHVGTVVAVHGHHRLPDDVTSAVAEPRIEAVYAVRFTAEGLWGRGQHTVTVNLWESYLSDPEAS
jgi:hypothetical protein